MFIAYQFGVYIKCNSKILNQTTMRRPVTLIFINAMILIVVFALLTQSLVVVQRIARVQQLQGLVEVQRSGEGEFMPLAKDGLIKTSDVIRTGKTGTAEFRWADGTRWKVMPNTNITVKKSSYNVVKKAERSQLKLSSGKVFIRIIKALGPSSKFEVQTPTAVAAVRGTIFSVEVKNGQTQVAVWKGSVKVTGNGEEDLIEPGTAAVADAQGLLHDQNSKTQDAEFRKQSTIVLPELDAELKLMSDGRVLISGSTEAGDRLTINGKSVRVLGNGFFRYRTAFKANTKYRVVTTDKHDVNVTKVLTSPASAS